MFNAIKKFFGISKRKRADYDLKRIIELRRSGKKRREIAAEMNLTLGQVSGAIHRHGKFASRYVPYSEADDQFIIVSWQSGMSGRAIAESMKRTTNAVNQRIHKLQCEGRLNRKNLRVVA
jgi:predicted transcriptional regulator